MLKKLLLVGKIHHSTISVKKMTPSKTSPQSKIKLYCTVGHFYQKSVIFSFSFTIFLNDFDFSRIPISMAFAKLIGRWIINFKILKKTAWKSFLKVSKATSLQKISQKYLEIVFKKDLDIFLVWSIKSWKKNGWF